MITTRAPDGANKLEICNIASDISAKFVIVQDKVKEENSEAAWQQSVQKGTAAVTAQSQSMLLVALKSRKFWKCDLRQRRFLRKSGQNAVLTRFAGLLHLPTKTQGENVPSVRRSLISSHLSYFVRCCQMSNDPEWKWKWENVLSCPPTFQLAGCYCWKYFQQLKLAKLYKDFHSAHPMDGPIL